MRKIVLTLVIAGAMALGTVSSARAQSGDATVVNVPFSFVANGKLLPAGKYRITTFGTDGTSVMIANESNQAPAVFAATGRVDGPSPSGSPPQVLFRAHGGQYFLWRVGIHGEARELMLQAREMDRVLARLNLLPPEPVLGSAK